MIDLQEGDKLVSGGGRSVYQHPQNPALVIKINKPGRKSKLIERLLLPEKRRFGCFREWYVEYNHYIALLNRRGSCPDYLPKFHGFANTSLGPGQVVEKISDKGSASLSTTLAQSRGSEDFGQSVLVNLAERFYDQIGADKLVFRDLQPPNFCIVRNRAGTPQRFVAVDGLGDYTLIPMRSLSDFVYRSWLRQARSDTLQFIRENFR